MVVALRIVDRAKRTTWLGAKHTGPSIATHMIAPPTHRAGCLAWMNRVASARALGARHASNELGGESSSPIDDEGDTDMYTRRNPNSLRVARRTVLLALGALTALAALAPMAHAATSVWVSPAPVKGPFSSCATPGYNSIQEAVSVNPQHSTINVCAGTYKEQLRIEKQVTIAAQSGSVLQLPASPVNSASSCDVAEEQDLITLCGAGKTKISGLTLEGRWPAGCTGIESVGVLVGGNTALEFTGSRILHAGPEPINGCQTGLGMLIGHNRNKQVGTAKLTNDLVEGYSKNGITIDGPGSTAKITSVTVKTEPTSTGAQNGIQVSRGATAKISGSTVEGNECLQSPACGPNEKAFSPWQEEEDATGILFYLAGGGSQVKNSTISGNDIGIYNLLQGSEAAKTTILGDQLIANRFWGVALDQGTATVSNDTIRGPGRVGIQIVQYGEPHQFKEPEAGQEFGARGSGKHDTITGMSACALEGLSDNNVKDLAGSLTITKSLAKFNENASEVCDNNTSGKLPISLT
jgi:hypothetical protein